MRSFRPLAAPDPVGGSPGAGAGGGADDGDGGDEKVVVVSTPKGKGADFAPAFAKVREMAASGKLPSATPGKAAPAAAAAAGGDDDGAELETDEAFEARILGLSPSERAKAEEDRVVALELLEQGGAAAGEGDDETPEELEARLAAMTPEEREDEETRLLEQAEQLVVELPPRREGEEPLRIEAPDQATADAMRAALNRGNRIGAVERLRDEAETRFAEADEIRYIVRADPTGFLDENVQDPVDRGHIVQFLLTRPGTMNAKIGNTTIGEWLRGVLDDPDTLGTEARLVESDRIRREKVVGQQLEVQRFEEKNARTCRKAMLSAIDTLVPEDWPDERRDRLFMDAWNDLRGKLRQENLRTADPRGMTGLVQGRLAQYGVAPRASGTKTPAGKRPGAAKPPVTSRTASDLKRTVTARRLAAGAGPGAGSPVAGIQKPPKGTLLTARKGKDGKMVASVFDYLRSVVRVKKQGA